MGIGEYAYVDDIMDGHGDGPSTSTGMTHSTGVRRSSSDRRRASLENTIDNMNSAVWGFVLDQSHEPALTMDGTVGGPASPGPYKRKEHVYEFVKQSWMLFTFFSAWLPGFFL